MLLGGTSNHFRTRTLRAVGGWDAWNVTEDADLGLRLARFGLRVEALRSRTFEEAPNSIGPFLRQRTRWMKGWMQTAFVHLRDPLALWRNLRPLAFLATVTTFVSGVLSPLLWPYFCGGLILDLLQGDAFRPSALWNSRSIFGLLAGFRRHRGDGMAGDSGDASSEPASPVAAAVSPAGLARALVRGGLARRDRSMAQPFWLGQDDARRGAPTDECDSAPADEAGLRETDQPRQRKTDR